MPSNLVPNQCDELESFLVITCDGDENLCEQYKCEIQLLQQLGVVPSSLTILPVADPKQCVGSGGATLNALYVAMEHISARACFGIVNPDLLERARVFIFHAGRPHISSAFRSSGIPLPVELTANSKVDGTWSFVSVTNLTMLVRCVVCQSPDDAAGVWVCGTDMRLSFHQRLEPYADADATVWTIKNNNLDLAVEHGIYDVDFQNDNLVRDISYRLDAKTLRKYEQRPGAGVHMVTGLVYFKPKLAAVLLALLAHPPLDRCTYLALDRAAEPQRLSLSFDILLPMCANQQSNFDQCHFRQGSKEVSHLLWSHLRRTTLKAAILKRTAPFFYFDSSGAANLASEYASWRRLSVDTLPAGMFYSSTALSAVYTLPDSPFKDPTANTSALHCLINSNCTIGRDALLLNSYADGLHVGQGSLISGATLCTDASIPSGFFYTEVLVKVPFLGQPVDGVALVLRPLAALSDHSSLTFTVVKRTRSAVRDFVNGQRCPSSTAMVDSDAERTKLAELHFAIAKKHCCDSLTWPVSGEKAGSPGACMPYFFWAVKAGYGQSLLAFLDQLAVDNAQYVGVVAAIFANIGDVLGDCMAARNGGLRSGPAGNQQWASAFQLLLKKPTSTSVAEAVRAMAKERTRWVGRSLASGDARLLVRAARHYEGAAQVLIRHACLTAETMITHYEGESSRGDDTMTPQRQSATSVFRWDEHSWNRFCDSRLPARVDLAGGWSDTPPICYEHGGRVLNVAVRLGDTPSPIGCRVRVRSDRQVCLFEASSEEELRQHDSDQDQGLKPCVSFASDDEATLAQYNQPQVRGALVKACIIFCGTLRVNRNVTGLDVQTWSDLPQGSGLGTSSILAGCLVGAMWAAAGRSFSLDDLMHAVVVIEQMLTTGGGWQDQVGGLAPAVTVGLSPATLPLHVEHYVVELSEDRLAEFQARSFLIYTGKTRLAKNLLQTVLRRWYSKEESACCAEDELVELARRGERALVEGDWVEFGSVLDRYQQLKVVLAPGTLLSSVTRIRTALQTVCLGSVLAGAGGGGFLFVLVNSAELNVSDIQALLKPLDDESLRVCPVAIDRTGLDVELVDF